MLEPLSEPVFAPTACDPERKGGAKRRKLEGVCTTTGEVQRVFRRQGMGKKLQISVHLEQMAAAPREPGSFV